MVKFLASIHGVLGSILSINLGWRETKNGGGTRRGKRKKGNGKERKTVRGEERMWGRIEGAVSKAVGN